jgi:hypothetical protein
MPSGASPMGTTRPAGATAGAPAVPGSAAGAWVTGAVDTAEVAGAELADGRKGPEQPAMSSASTDENTSAARDVIIAFCLLVVTPKPTRSRPRTTAATHHTRNTAIRARH